MGSRSEAMKLPRLTRSGLILALLASSIALQAQTTAVEFNRLGAADRRNGRFDMAIGDFTKAIELDPHYAVAYSNRGGAKRAKGDLDGAIADFNQAIALKPDFASAYNNRGGAKLAKRDLDGAMTDFTKAIELDPKHVIGVGNLATAKKLKDQFPRGVTSAQDEAVFARQERANRDAVDAMSQPPPPDR
jgi:tetratricopeptide (TPR) repeat protein